MTQWKLITYLIIAILAANLALALTDLPVCEDLQAINQNCTMITPQVTQCSIFNYTIYNTTNASASKIVEQNLLSELNASIYFLNFTQPEGSYIVSLCDGTTREIKVTERDSGNMIIAVLVMLPILFAFILLIAALSMGDTHAILKTFLFLLSFVMFWVSLHFGLTALIKFYNFPEMQELIGTTVEWTSWILFAIISYFFIYMIYLIFKNIAEKKKEKLEY
jgi:hypothetical protein